VASTLDSQGPLGGFDLGLIKGLSKSTWWPPSGFHPELLKTT